MRKKTVLLISAIVYKTSKHVIKYVIVYKDSKLKLIELNDQLEHIFIDMVLGKYILSKKVSGKINVLVADSIKVNSWYLYNRETL